MLLFRSRRSASSLAYLVTAVVVLIVLIFAVVLYSRISDHASFGDEAGLGGVPSDLLFDADEPILGLSLLEAPSGSASNPAELRERISELLRIKRSVQKELAALEKALGERRRQEASLVKIIEELKSEANRRQAEMDRLQLSMAQAKRALKEYTERNTPEIRAPLSRDETLARSILGYAPPPGEAVSSCLTMSSCWEYSVCGLTTTFGVYDHNGELLSAIGRPASHDLFRDEPNPQRACLLAYIVKKKPIVPEHDIASWGGDGRNHLLVDFAPEKALSSQLQPHRAIVMSTNFRRSRFRPGFDLIAPYMSPRDEIKRSAAAVWERTPNILPVRRKYLLSFLGSKKEVSEIEQRVIQTVRDFHTDRTDDKSLVNERCDEIVSDLAYFESEWALCSNRTDVLLQSTFSLILLPLNNPDFVSSEAVQLRLVESLQHGAIPVVIGSAHSYDLMPFAEVIDWKKAVISIPVARTSEMHFLLRSFTDGDLFSMQRQGRLIWKTYLSSQSQILQTTLSILRERLLLPPPTAIDTPSPSVFERDSPRLLMDQLPADLEPSEPLGPLEQPSPSVGFRRNFSQLFIDSHVRWNRYFNPLVMTPQEPWGDVELPTDAKFLGSAVGFRPIGDGEGGSGKEFSRALGGNTPAEQFTVVMLTFEREQVLIDSLIRLFGLPYMNKVVVVWNSPDKPSSDLRWPDIGVPIEVIKTERNSLNNRFLPYDVIETEAILSVDDDAHLRHDEIIFGFRVWREHRDRLVGFPGRFHAWDLEFENGWNYNSNYSCELSMVLTGASFYHKYYNYMYSYWMPTAIREKVDEYMNCEDLAMNFLISHLTRKPPVKVTSRWTFRCPGCPVSLSEDDSHFQGRIALCCLGHLTSVMLFFPYSCRRGTDASISSPEFMVICLYCTLNTGLTRCFLRHEYRQISRNASNLYKLTKMTMESE